MLLLALVKLFLPAMGFAAGGADMVTGPWFSNFMSTNFREEKYSTLNFHLFRVSNHLFYHSLPFMRDHSYLFLLNSYQAAHRRYFHVNLFRRQYFLCKSQDFQLMQLILSRNFDFPESPLQLVSVCEIF